MHVNRFFPRWTIIRTNNLYVVIIFVFSFYSTHRPFGYHVRLLSCAIWSYKLDLNACAIISTTLQSHEPLDLIPFLVYIQILHRIFPYLNSALSIFGLIHLYRFYWRFVARKRDTIIVEFNYCSWIAMHIFLRTKLKLPHGIFIIISHFVINLAHHVLLFIKLFFVSFYFCKLFADFIFLRQPSLALVFHLLLFRIHPVKIIYGLLTLDLELHLRRGSLFFTILGLQFLFHFNIIVCWVNIIPLC